MNHDWSFNGKVGCDTLGTFVQIELDPFTKEKCIHYMGYGYVTDENLWKWIDYTFFEVPLSEALSVGILDYEANEGFMTTQYVRDCAWSEIEAVYRSVEGPVLDEKNVNMDTPCGEYIIVRR